MDLWIGIIILILYAIIQSLSKKKKPRENPVSAPSMEDLWREVGLIADVPQTPESAASLRTTSPLPVSEGPSSWPEEYVGYSSEPESTISDLKEEVFESYKPAGKKDSGPSAGARLRQQLKRRTSAREAFLVSEILGMPHVHRRRGRSRPTL